MNPSGDKRYWTIPALLILQTACTQTSPPAPPDTRAADEKAIRDGEAQWLKDINAKDLDKVLAPYADDASVLLADRPIISGKDAIRNIYRRVLADPALAMDGSTVKVEVSKSGDLAYSQGTLSRHFTDPKTKKVLVLKQKYLDVYKKQADGSWKIVEDNGTHDGPAAPAK